MQEESDENLMIRVKNGDALAFSILMDRYKQAVVNLVAYTVGDNIDSEDIAQHVFIRVYKSAANYEVRSKFTTWLFTITKNLALNEIRRRKRHPTDSLDVVEQEEDYSKTKQYPDTKTVAPDDSLMNDEMRECLTAALEELPERQRLALLMFQEQGLSYEEISEILEISLSSTKSLIFRARNTLKKTLKEYLSSESAT
ncbi:MAG: sigma-70 family RNA polymerase sigma factor [Verrucomicrobia bacterium]|nr:sigma-70 family RNA polymerase sigma factor [Verrucomicrobiota bacterium]